MTNPEPLSKIDRPGLALLFDERVDEFHIILCSLATVVFPCPLETIFRHGFPPILTYPVRELV